MASLPDLALARAQCSISEDDTTFDDLLTIYIGAAQRWVENHTGKLLVKREVNDRHPAFGAYFRLFWGPVDADTVAVSYTDSDGADQELTGATVNGDRLYPVAGSWWPSVQSNTGVRVTYTAGYEDGDIPEPLVQAMLLLIGHWFLNREAANDQSVSEVPFAVLALVDQYRDAML